MKCFGTFLVIKQLNETQRKLIFFSFYYIFLNEFFLKRINTTLFDQFHFNNGWEDGDPQNDGHGI